jgi:hypothetical protein
MRIFFLFFLVILLNFSGNAQQYVKDSVMRQYAANYNTPKEIIYTSFNKNIFFAGEKIWFKNYVLNGFNRKPFVETTNLYIELFDPNGKLVTRKLYRVTNGVCSGDILVPISATSGYYTFKAYTAWSRNFSDAAFIKQIEVSGTKANAVSNSIIDSSIKVSFHPEGGSIIAGIENIIAFKATDAHGYGIAMQGEIKNQQKTISAIQTSEYGTGTLRYTPAVNEVLTAVISFNGRKQEFALPLISDGLQLHLVNVVNKKLQIAVKTSQQKLLLQQPKTVYILFHRQGYSQLFSLLLNGQRTAENLSIPISGMRSGVWHVSLLDENGELLNDRPVFINNDCNDQLVVMAKRQKDSLHVNISMDTITASKLIDGLSVSILPVSKTNNSTVNMSARYLLAGDLGSSVENVDGYFNGCEIVNTDALDELLLANTITPQQWKKILNNKPFNIQFPFEHGLVVKGEVLGYKPSAKPRSVFLFSLLNDFYIPVTISDDGKFELKDLNLKDSSIMNINATSTSEKKFFKGLNVLANNLNYDSTDIIVPHPLRVKYNIPVEQAIVDTNIYHILEDVKVTAKIPSGDVFERDPLVMPGDKKYKVNAAALNRYHSLIQLLQSEFGIRIGTDSNGNPTANMGRGEGSFLLKYQPTLVVDGIIMQDLSYLNVINVIDVEAIAVNKDGNAMLGSRGAGGSIIIKLRNNLDNIYDNSFESTMVGRVMVKGYATPSVYSRPKYLTGFSNPRYAPYLSVYFDPSIQPVKGASESKFWFPRELKEFMLKVEGITTEGEIISFEKKIIVQE